MMHFEELDNSTRQHMLEQFEHEQQTINSYRSRGLTVKGLERFPIAMCEAIAAGQ